MAHDFHPFRWEDAEDPFDALKELRQQCPISKPEFAPLPPIVFLTRYDDLAVVFRDWKTFNNMGVSIDAEAHRDIPPEKQQIISSNPPHHGAKRRLMLNAVAPAPVDRAKPDLRRFANRTVDRFAERGQADLIAQWAKPIPSAGIALVLGLPLDDCERHGEWTTQIVMSASRMSPSHPEFGTVPPGGEYGTVDFAPFAYLQEQINMRRDGDIAEGDGMSAMLQAVHPKRGESYTDLEIVEAVNTMLAAGNETTTSLMGNLVWRLAQDPGLFSVLRSDRSLVPVAIEESLRIDPPQQIFERLCVKDAQIGGTDINEGDVIVLSLASGNRDESVYGDDSDQFRLDRVLPNPANWSMGGGIHTCVGAYLARSSAEIGMNALLDRISAIELQPNFSYEKCEFHHFRGPRKLDVHFTTAD